MKIIEEFKTFAMLCNVLDMAVGIIIGAAFGKIISSFVGDVLMPPIGLLLGNVDFTSLSFILKPAVEKIPAVAINYGKFIQTVIDFIIIAFSIFMMVKAVNSLKKKQEEAPAEVPEPTAEEKLLIEIRDILKNK
jgi:large conductance mechanosensitive channel